MRQIACAAALAAGLGLLTPSHAGATDLRMVSGFPLNFIFTEEIAKTFITNVEAASEGNISIDLSGPDAVPTFEQFEPVRPVSALPSTASPSIRPSAARPGSSTTSPSTTKRSA